MELGLGAYQTDSDNADGFLLLISWVLYLLRSKLTCNMSSESWRRNCTKNKNAEEQVSIQLSVQVPHKIIPASSTSPRRHWRLAVRHCTSSSPYRSSAPGVWRGWSGARSSCRSRRTGTVSRASASARACPIWPWRRTPWRTRNTGTRPRKKRGATPTLHGS